jgi:hypothetical protein
LSFGLGGGDEFDGGLGDVGEAVGPKFVFGGQAEAAGDAFGQRPEGDGCEGVADAADLGALAVIVGVGAMAGGALRALGRRGVRLGAFWGGEIEAVSGQDAREGHEPAEGVGRGGGAAGGGAIEGDGVTGEAVNRVAEACEEGEARGAG